MSILDIVILVVLIVGLISGFVFGFIKLVGKRIASTLALVIGFIGGYFISYGINQTSWYINISGNMPAIVVTYVLPFVIFMFPLFSFASRR